jgi:hypothetical protein
MTEQSKEAFEKWYIESGLIDRDVAYEAWEACDNYHGEQE